MHVEAFADRTTLIRAASLYLPITAVAIVAFVKSAQRRLFASSLVAFAWTVTALLALQLLNLDFHWWSFHAEGGLFRGMPVDLYLGWAVLWSVLPVLLFRGLPVPWVAAIFACLDLLMMPLCRPVVELSSRWLVGESIALALVLLPSLYFARWTLEDRRLVARATLQAITATAFVLFLLPEIVFAMRGWPQWSSLSHGSIWIRDLLLQAVALLGMPALSALQEFVTRGRGTPIPYDPPQRLVISGLYRYVANPMQISGALVLLAWGALLHSLWIDTAAVGTIAYCIGLAGWDERADLEERFGEPWRRYRLSVHDWYPRWRPYFDHERPLARIYIAQTCGICSELQQWLQARSPLGLAFIAAEAYPGRALRRVTYDPMDGSPIEEGTDAFARALEHINLGWAYVGAFMRLPLIADLAQILADSSGLAPKSIPNHNRCQL